MSDQTIPQIIPIPNKFIKDIAGQRFGSLAVIGFVGSRQIGSKRSVRAHWLCECDCGARVVIDGANLRSGNTKNCGCERVQRSRDLGKANKTHGMKRTPEYRAWNNLRDRCKNPRSQAYAKYGGRGIKVCEDWESFEQFYIDMGPRPGAAHSIDRIDNDGDYCPDNCRWATRLEQMNNRGSNRPITYNGATHTIAEWAQVAGINYFTLWSRIVDYGWDMEQALTPPS